jgi:mono/diheme cytochrome c family protein
MIKYVLIWGVLMVCLPSTVLGVQDAAEKTLIEKGRYLSRAANCYSCHKSPQGGPYTGGVGFETPFGTIYSTNITSDVETGIGSYSEADFDQAVRHGYSSIRGYLYAAMPFNSYRDMSDDDVKALWAYFKNLPAIRYEVPENQMTFPANIRLGLFFWNAFFLEESSFVEDSSRTPAWNRGRYLATALGHCGECHTPRNLFMAPKTDSIFEGNILEGWLASNLTVDGLTAQGWNKADMIRYLKYGNSRQGAPSASMHSVVHDSTSYLTNKDLDSMATYLLSTDTQKLESKPYPALTAKDRQDPGYNLYAQHCAGCHGANGQGAPPSVPSMQGNSSNTLSDPYASVTFVLRGLPDRHPQINKNSQGMPGFVDKLSAAEVAELVTFMRRVWGEQTQPVSIAEVERIVEQLRDDNWLYRHSEH